ncbi:MAG: hypothetical protein ACKO0V_01735, partial [bacterium]
LCGMTAWAGRTRSELSKPTSESGVSPRLMQFSMLLVPMAYLQVVAGGWLRHFQALQALYIHELLGVSVVVAITLYTVQIKKSGLSVHRPVRRVRAILVGLAHLQWLFGFAAWWLLRPFNGVPKPVTDTQALVRTFHQANGALVLGLTGVMVLWVVTAYLASAKSVDSSILSREAVCLS